MNFKSEKGTAMINFLAKVIVWVAIILGVYFALFSDFGVITKKIDERFLPEIEELIAEKVKDGKSEQYIASYDLKNLMEFYNIVGCKRLSYVNNYDVDVERIDFEGVIEYKRVKYQINLTVKTNGEYNLVLGKRVRKVSDEYLVLLERVAKSEGLTVGESQTIGEGVHSTKVQYKNKYYNVKETELYQPQTAILEILVERAGK